MSITYTCDYCGEPIGENDPYVTFSVEGTHSDDRWSSGYVGHYHSDERTGRAAIRAIARGEYAEKEPSGIDCWMEVDRAFRLIHGVGSDLTTLPTTEMPDGHPKPGDQRNPEYDEYQRRAESGTRLQSLIPQAAIYGMRDWNIVTLEDVAQVDPAEVSRMRGVGAKTMALLESALDELGLTWESRSAA